MIQNIPDQFNIKVNAVSTRQAEQALLIVGHPLTDYHRVENVLQGVGMAPARATKQQDLAPTEISSRLLKRAGLVADYSISIEQIAPSPIWQILALDLFLGNSEAGFWGWSDPQCIYLLDYWYATDSALHFIFVYDSLEHVLVRASEDQELTQETIQQLTIEWQCFYTALLHFYHRHRDRCLLVHAEQACVNPEAFDKALSFCLQRPLERDSNAAVVAMAMDIVQTSLAANIIVEQDTLRSIYDDLQAQADFPLATAKTTDLLAAWNSFSALTSQLRLDNDALSSAETQLVAMKNKLVLAEQKKEEDQPQFGDLLKQLEQKSAQSLTQELQQENDLLLLQLHQVQEELERYYLENKQLKQRSITTRPVKQRPQTSSTARYGAADRIKHQLSYRLGAIMIKQSNSLSGLLGMPRALLREAREYDEDKKNRIEEKLPPISKYADAHEAERIKGHLSYRLGATLLANHHSPIGWIKLPWLLKKQINLFKLDRATR